MNLKDWFKLQPDGDNDPRKDRPRNEKPLCCVYCDAYARIDVDEDGPVVVCVRNPRHRERV